MKNKSFTGFLADVAIKRWWLVIAIFVVLTIISLFLSQNIDIVVDPEDLMSKDNPTAQRFFDVLNSFDTAFSLVVTVEGEDKELMVNTAHTVEQRIYEDDELSGLFRTINLKADAEYPMKWGLMLADDVNDIEDIQRLLEQRSVLGTLTALNNTLEDVVLQDDDEFATNQDEWDGVASLAGFERLVNTIKSSLAGTGQDSEEYWETAAQELLESIFIGEQYNWSPEEDMLTFSLLPSYGTDDIDLLYKSVYGVNEIIQSLNSELEGIELNIGGELGWIVARHEGVGSDMVLPTVIALLLIIVLFFFSFTKIRKILLAVLALIVGILISMGAIAITFGQITMITSIFAVILLGLGIDFGIHLISNYDDFRLKGRKPAEAMHDTMHSGGAPIILGGITTACAFFALGLFSSAPAVHEFGIVAGMGVVITLLSMVLFLPALIIVLGGSGEIKKTSKKPMINFSFMAGLGKYIERHPLSALLFALLLTIVAAIAIPMNRIDYDPMNNSPRNHPITKTQEKIIEKMRIAPFVSFSVNESIEDLREMTDKFRQEYLVSRVASASDFFPPKDEEEERIGIIAAGGPAGPGASDDLSGLDKNTPRTIDDIEHLLEEIQRLEWNVIELGDLAVAGLGEDNMVVQRRDAMIREIIGAEVGKPGREVFQTAIEAIRADPETASRRLTALDSIFAEKMAGQQQNMYVDRAPGIEDIPLHLRDQFISKDNTLFMAMIMPTAETQESSDRILEYQNSLTEIDSGLTGSVPIYVALINEIFTEAARAGIYVAIVVFILLFIIFRKIKHVILAFTMVVLGLLWLFGLLPLAGTHLTLTAGLVLPLLIGIGTDDAMHIMHRYRHEKGDIVKTLRYSGKAVLLTTLTTMIGFGSLGVIGTMETISSIGILLFIGIGTCFLATVIALPALLGLNKKVNGGKNEKNS